MLVSVDKNNFDEYIEKPCIADFYTSDCPSCEKFLPVFEAVSKEYENYTFLKVNLDDDISLAERFGIQHIPTILKFENKEVVKSVTGYMDVETFKEFIETK